jgi:hypothetical protein
MKSFRLFFKKTPLIYYSLIAIFVLFIIIFLFVYRCKEGLTNIVWGSASGSSNVALQSGLTMKVSVDNTYQNISDPNPNEYYKASVDTFNIPAYVKGNNQAILPYFLSNKVIDTSNILLTIEPATTNVNVKHNADVFPLTFQINVYMDFSNNSMKLDDKSKNPTIIVNSDGVLNANKIGVIIDYSMNVIGYVKKDIMDPTHYFAVINKPTNIIKKVVFTWSLMDLCQNELPGDFLGKCANYGNCVAYSSDTFFNKFSGFSYLNTTISGNAISGNAILGNSILGNSILGNSIYGNAISGNAISGNAISGYSSIGSCSPGTLCSGVYQVPKN